MRAYQNGTVIFTMLFLLISLGGCGRGFQAEFSRSSTSLFDAKGECMNGVRLSDGTCQPNMQNCTIENGLGFQVWNGDSYGACQVLVCDRGYDYADSACVPSSGGTPVCPPVENGIPAYDDYWGCMRTCSDGFFMTNNNLCQSPNGGGPLGISIDVFTGTVHAAGGQPPYKFKISNAVGTVFNTTGIYPIIDGMSDGITSIVTDSAGNRAGIMTTYLGDTTGLNGVINNLDGNFLYGDPTLFLKWKDNYTSGKIPHCPELILKYIQAATADGHFVWRDKLKDGFMNHTNEWSYLEALSSSFFGQLLDDSLLADWETKISDGSESLDQIEAEFESSPNTTAYCTRMGLN